MKPFTDEIPSPGIARSLLDEVSALRAGWRRRRDLRAYHRGGRLPWSRGYGYHKWNTIVAALDDTHLLSAFQRGALLPSAFGEYLDERVIEYPWFLTQLATGSGRLLDAGGALNMEPIMRHPNLAARSVTVLNLEPEGANFVAKRVAYVFADMCNTPFRDNWFQDVACLSSLEHVGMDNQMYGAAVSAAPKADAFLFAISELRRILAPGGRLFISVPFGRYLDRGWYQQFDSSRIDQMVDAFAPTECDERYYRYAGGGWQPAERIDCIHEEHFDIQQTRYCDPSSTRDYDSDLAAAARAVALLVLTK